MTIVSLVLLLLGLGVVGYLIQQYAPMEGRIKSLTLWALVAIAVLVLLYAFGVLPAGGARVPTIR